MMSAKGTLPWPALLALAITPAWGQQPPVTPEASPAQAAAPAPEPGPAACCLLAGGTPLQIEIGEAISSKRRKRGEKFALRLAEPVLVDGRIMLPAKTAGVGEIIHAAPSGGGGKPGELLLSARYLEFEGRQIPLRGFRIGATGTDRSNASMTASLAIGPFAQFIHGSEIEIPAGARASARLAADAVLPPPAVATPDTPATDASTTITNQE